MRPRPVESLNAHGRSEPAAGWKQDILVDNLSFGLGKDPRRTMENLFQAGLGRRGHCHRPPVSTEERAC